MATTNLLSAEETALVTAYLIHGYEQEKGKELTRFRLSRDSVRLLGLRANLRDAFAEEWRDALASEWGWIAFPRGEEFGLIRSSAISGWVRLGTKRLSDDRRKLKKGDRSVLDRMQSELMAAKVQDDEEQEED